MWLSVIMAAYNAEATLPAAVESLLGQWRDDVELIIVNDGSSDQTGAIAGRYAAAHAAVRAINKANGGTASALNAALKMASGEFISRLDADDELAGEYLESMHECVRTCPNFDIYAPDLWGVDAQGTAARLYGWSEVRSFGLRDLLTANTIPGPGTLVRRRTLDACGGFREGIFNEDYDLWLRAVSGGARHIYWPIPLYRYRVGATGQKTTRFLRQYGSDIRILADLLASGSCRPEDVGPVRSAIANRCRLMMLLPLRRLVWLLERKSGLTYPFRRRNGADGTR